MKIALLNQPIGTISLPWTVQESSIEIWTYEVARRLARSCDVIVYAKRGRHQKKVEYNQGVNYRRVSAAADEWLTRAPGLRNAIPLLLSRNIKRPFFASKFHYLTYVLQVAKDLRKKKCDIVHLHNFSQFVPIIRAFNPKIKIVLQMHCEWLTQLDRAMIEHRLREVDLIIGCSEHITEKIRLVFPQFAKRCQTVLNGVDINRFVSKNNHNTTVRASEQKKIKKILYVGRVSPEKGLHVLLDAFRKVSERYPEAQLEIVGPQVPAPIEFIVSLSDDPKVSDLATFYHGRYLPHLQRKVPSEVASQVSFAGVVSRRQLINCYQKADVFILPSVWNEPFGIPIVEAMATEIPVVATRVGGIIEVVEDGKTGILVEPNDTSELAEAILHLLSDEDLRKSMGKAARKRAVEHFSWEKTVENLLCQYKKICDAHE